MDLLINWRPRSRLMNDLRTKSTVLMSAYLKPGAAKMNDSDRQRDISLTDDSEKNPISSSIVQRRSVPDNLTYSEYRPYLRRDFIYSCAYCSICEFESQGVGFDVEHYEPQSAHPELSNTYSNLMYSCRACNIRKGDRCPPQSARDAGLRFFKADLDEFVDHFELQGRRLRGLSPCGEFTIDAISLNRTALIRVRELRERAGQALDRVARGIGALRYVKIDSLPKDVRLRAKQAIESALEKERHLAETIDTILAEYARSDFIPDEADPEEQRERRTILKKLSEQEKLYPGVWHQRQGRKKKR